MRGVVFTGHRGVALRSFPDPTPGPGEAVVRMRASGLCGSDLTPYRAAEERDNISGHEPVGEVAALGAGVDWLRVGDRVMFRLTRAG